MSIETINPSLVLHFFPPDIRRMELQKLAETDYFDAKTDTDVKKISWFQAKTTPAIFSQTLQSFSRATKHIKQMF